MDLVSLVVGLQFSINVALKACECLQGNVGVIVGVQKITAVSPSLRSAVRSLLRCPDHQVGGLGRWLPLSSFPNQHLDLCPEQLQELSLVTPGLAT